MKKLLLSLTCLLGLTPLANAQSPKVTLDFSDNTTWKFPEGSANGIKTGSYTADAYTISLNATDKFYFNTSGKYLMLGKKNSTLTLPAFDFEVDKIEATLTDGSSTSAVTNIFVGDNAVSTQYKGNKSHTFELTKTDKGTVYIYKVTSAHNVQIKSISIYEKLAADQLGTSIEFTPEGESTVAVGTTVTASCVNAVTYDYTVDYSDASLTDINQTGVSEVSVDIAGSCTISVTAHNGTQTTTGSATYTAVKPVKYSLITNIGYLKAGDEVIIVNSQNAKAMGANSGTYFLATDIDLNDDMTVAYSFEALNLTLECDESGWYFKAGDKYLANPATGNAMNLSADKTDSSKALISITDNNAEIAFQGTNEAKYIRYNSNPTRFSCYKSGQNPVQIFRKGDAPVVTVQPVEFSIPGGSVKAGTTVELTCATDGAAIYYTIDNTAPSASSTPYNGPITINKDLTIQAIAINGADKSIISSATFTIVSSVTSLAEMYTTVGELDNKAYSDEFIVDFNPVVTYVNGANVYIAEGGKYGFIYKSDSGLVAGDKVAGAWAAKVQNFNGLYEIIPVGAVASDGTAEIPAPVEISAAAQITKDIVSARVLVKNVVFAEATKASKAAFTGTVEGSTVNFYNTFTTASVEAGKYDVYGVISIYETSSATTLQVSPIEYRPASSSGIGNIEADGNAPVEYFNLQGVRVDNPENGIFIRRQGSTVTKVVK